MIHYRYGPLNICTTFNNDCDSIHEIAKKWYDHVLIPTSDNNFIDHHCHISNWETNKNIDNSNKEVVSWVGKSVYVNDKDYSMKVEWENSNYNSIISASFGKLDYEIPENTLWEVTQRISTLPILLEKNCFLIHCSSIIVNEKLILFLGSSGAGKSTIAEIAKQQGYEVLHDDTLIVQEKDNELIGYASPYITRSKIIGRSGGWKISKFYILEKSLSNNISDVTRKEFTEELMKSLIEAQFLAPMFRYSQNKDTFGEIITKKLIVKSLNIAKNYTAHRLSFNLNIDISKFLLSEGVNQ